MPTSIWLRGHNHISTIARTNTAEEQLGAVLLISSVTHVELTQHGSTVNDLIGRPERDLFTRVPRYFGEGPLLAQSGQSADCWRQPVPLIPIRLGGAWTLASRRERRNPATMFDLTFLGNGKRSIGGT